MKPTELLKEEHKAIKSLLRVLTRVISELEAGKPVSPQHLELMVQFIRLFADKRHHMKEENLLFPAMEAAGIPREGGPVSVMLMEHNSGREYVRGMSNAIEGYRKGEYGAAAKIAYNARNYVVLLDQHIDKEDDILYEMADNHIPEDKQKELEAEFARVEQDTTEVPPAEHFYKTLHELESIYLK